MYFPLGIANLWSPLLHENENIDNEPCKYRKRRTIFTISCHSLVIKMKKAPSLLDSLGQPLLAIITPKSLVLASFRVS
jgi:hypothetical protein